jgi:subtilisin family serine protease
MDLSQMPDILPTLKFNQKTIWPDASRMPAGLSPDELLQAAMNPGLGVRELHRLGITGLNVRVAIIDQPMYLDHPEFAGKIAAYYDTGCRSDSSMHGPAVTSLLVGTATGTAPEAVVYFAAAPSWLADTEYCARALEWILEENRKLPPESKIRVVSVSAAPSGPGSPFMQNQERWDRVTAAAEAEGMLVLDCTSHRGIISPCWFTGGDPEDPANYAPGFPGLPPGTVAPNRLMAPTSPRTTAEEYDPGDFGYQYCGRGGLSWAIPYVAGVLALGWQVRPELDARQMVQLLFQSAYMKEGTGKVIQPREFLRLVKEFQAGLIPERAVH